jgi:D-lactate dehydrogenase
LQPVTFTSVAEAVELAWHVREGLLGLIGKLRPQGSMLITEDVCFPRDRLAKAAHDLQALMSKHGFVPGVAGHAAHGNLHFLLIARFDNEEGRARYSAFMDELVELVVRKHDGSLKAEHGTGINMAPFVAAEWGEKATQMMWRIKELADPHGVLGPNVILTRNANVHLEALKSVPLIEDVEGASHCIECGFCEPVCPSRNITTTPRQRIVLRREMARQPEDSPLLQRLQEDYEYDAIETCAGDGSCSIPCPIGINTGSLMREFRKTAHNEREKHIALSIARHWATVEHLSRAGLSAAEIIYRIAGVAPLKALTGLARSIVCEDLIPSVPGPMPRPAEQLPVTEAKGADAVYFPACINRMFGRDPSKPSSPSLSEALLHVSARAGKQLWIPDDVAGHCCSTPFKSKGYEAAHDHMAATMADALWRWSDSGRLPVIVDAASCTLGILEDIPKALDEQRREQFKRVHIMDSVSWVQALLPSLTITKKLPRVILHPTCSMNHLQLVQAFHDVAQHIGDEVIIPLGAACCGTAGDRGLLHPELVVSATRDECESIEGIDADAYLSANRTCEMGMRHATGKPYESFVFALEQLTRPAS